MCVFTSGAGGLGGWAGSLRGLTTDPAGKELKKQNNKK